MSDISRPMTATSETGTVQHAPISTTVVLERRCTLWVHGDSDYKDEVVVNLELFPYIKPGDLLAISVLKTDSGVRDFQEKPPVQKSGIRSHIASKGHERIDLDLPSLFQTNGPETKHDADHGKRYLFIAKEMAKEVKAKQSSLEISVAKHIADAFCLKHRSTVLVTTVDAALNSASHVELCFKDEYLARSDMWRMALSELFNKTVFKGQKLLFMGTIKAQVTSVYVNGRRVQSAFFSNNTRPIFRSESARFVLFIQMSREMWDFDSEGSGEIMFNKVVNGFLPALFKKWAALKAKHLVSIVLFTRVEYDTGITSELATNIHDSNYHTGTQSGGNKKPYKDFFRVVVSEMASGSWTAILYQLKREFKFFRRDISLHRIDTMSATVSESLENNTGGVLGTRIEAEPSFAMHGNVLEAINLASSQFARDYIDRDLMRTGISIVVITPSPGLFEVDYEMLRMTTETLTGNGIGIDLVCLPKMPLHSVPLFRYRNPQYAAFQEELHFKSIRSEDSTPRQNAHLLGSSFSSTKDSLSPSKTFHGDRGHRTAPSSSSDPPSEWCYAIPHWIDVSFWTGASQDSLLISPSLKVLPDYRKERRARHHQGFEVRCKLYEMEMASIMETILSEISVAPLQHDGLFPQMKMGPKEEPGKQSGSRVPDCIQQEKPYSGLLEFVSGPSKPLTDRLSPAHEKAFYKALDAYDLTRSELTEVPPGSRQHKNAKRMSKAGSEEATKRLLAEDSKVFGTSFSSETGIPNISFDSSDSPGRKALVSLGHDRDNDGVTKNRKNSVASSMTIPSTTLPIQPARLGRQISLGKYGFGIAAPKAAMAELQTEHVNAATSTAATPKLSRSRPASSVTMASHLLNVTQTPDRPLSSQSEKSQMKAEASAPEVADKVEKTSASQPMTIKSALQSLDSTNQFKSRSVLGSLYEELDRNGDADNSSSLKSVRPDDTQKLYNSKLLAGAVPELPTTLSPTTALSPWLTVLNPSNPSANDALGPSQYRRWQHVFPRPTSKKTMKWKSLCAPASVPLTTGYFPTGYQLDTEYQQQPYNISLNPENELSEVPKSRVELLWELIGLRLSQGFQVVVGPAVGEAFGQKVLKIANIFDHDGFTEDGASVFMSMGSIIHQLSCVKETEIEVNMFLRKPTASTTGSPGSVVPAIYKPAIRTTLAEAYETRQIVVGKPREDYNWNYVDTFVAGYVDDMCENLRFWRARFVLIPVERPSQSQRRQGEDNEEEVRLEGIKKLTQLWQRHRILTPSERRFQSVAARKTKDPNPLDIVYKTDDPSIVVTAELETLPLLEGGDATTRRGQLIESERFRKTKLGIAALAEAIQAPVERGGVRVQNRRWHFRLHYNCFIGSDMTTWLLENFEDINTREEAVELGNMLMIKDDKWKEANKDSEKEKSKDMGIFVHVEKRHAFRDGQYFYQVTGEYAKQRPETRSGWFASRRRDNSIPSTPITESALRPERSRSSSNYDEKSSDSGATTPTTTSNGKRPKVALSKVMKYDTDHRKRSYRAERINLHYDRLHNPDNCYHIRIDWMSVTAKLIEDAIESWATTAERHGLKLVEAPIGEACSITSFHPFRSPYVINLALQPPDQQPRTYFDVNSFAPQVQSSPASRHYYQKAIMKRFNFVLDVEAAKNFPSNVDVTYSWGKPDFKYTQYIHRSGVLLAQITDEGNFLLLANRLYNNRTTAAREMDRYFKPDHGSERNTRMTASNHHYSTGITSDRPSPANSPLLRPLNTSSPIIRATSDVLGPSPFGLTKPSNIITPEAIKNEVETFCQSAALLEVFYKEVLEKATPPSATPPNLKIPYNWPPGEASALGSEANIPALGLPPGVYSLSSRDSSPSPMRSAGGPLQMPLMPFMGRRASAQVGGSEGSGKQEKERERESPRGSIGEGEK